MSEQEKLVNETLEEINAYLPKMIKGIEGFVESQLEGQESKSCCLISLMGLNGLFKQFP